jgi:hypothetical protein
MKKKEKKIKEPSEKVKFDIPAKYGKFKLKKKDGEVYIMLGKEKIGSITLPFYTGRFFINVWALYKENTMIECFTSLEDTLKHAEKALKPVKIKKPTLRKK